MPGRRAAVPGMPSAGVILERGMGKQAGSPIAYPLIVETILHVCGVNVVPMEDDAVMLRFPSTNGFVVSVPLSPQGCDELVAQIEQARAGQQVTPPATVEE